MSSPTLLLIHPAQDKDRLGKIRRRRSSIPKLNLPILAAYADKHFTIRIIDESIEEIDFDQPADLVGITVITQVAGRAYEIADRFRKRGVKVVLGGFHVGFFPDEAQAHADSLVLGEAEGAWEHLLADFLSGSLLPRYENSRPHDLQKMPTPRIDLLKNGAYSFYNVIETARGCPHRCSYCAVSLYWGHRFRFRPVDEVVEEIRGMPPGPIIFVDDNIIGSPKRAKELFAAMAPLKRTWYGQADMKINRDPELLDLMVKSGCKWLFVGIESLNTVNIEGVGKSRVNAEKEYKSFISTLQDKGIHVLGSFIFGFDQDGPEVFEKTVKFCVDNRLAAANFYLLTPMPFTELFTQMEQDGRILHQDWSRYDMNHVVFRPAKMTPEELLDGYLSAYRSFYSLPSIVRRLRGVRRELLQLLALNIGRRLNYRNFERGCRY